MRNKPENTNLVKQYCTDIFISKFIYVHPNNVTDFKLYQAIINSVESLGKDRDVLSSNKIYDSTTGHRYLMLSHKDAMAGSPYDASACGEEDVGSGLEFLVDYEDVKK